MTQPKKREKVRDNAVNLEMLHDYIEELEKTLDKYEIKNKPQHTRVDQKIRELSLQ